MRVCVSHPHPQTRDLLDDARQLLANVYDLNLPKDSVVNADARVLQARVGRESRLGRKRRGASPSVSGAATPSCQCSSEGEPSPAPYCDACVTNPGVMVGKRVWVYWMSDDTWYSGAVEAQEATSKQFRVVYVPTPSAVAVYV